MSISVDRRLDIFKRQVRYLLVSRKDVPAALQLLCRHGETQTATPVGGYAEGRDTQRIPVDNGQIEVALRLIAAGGPGALTMVESLGCPLDMVHVELRQPVMGGEATATIYVDGEQVWPAVAEGVAA